MTTQPKRSKPGKYQEWRTPEGLALLRSISRRAKDLNEIAATMGVARQTLHEWRKKYPDINDALKKGKRVRIAEAEDALEKLGQGHTVKEKKTYVTIRPDGSRDQRVEEVERYIPPNVAALIFYLKNADPQNWRDRQEQAVELSVPVIFEGEDELEE